MKKYMLFLFVIVFSLFTINVNPVHASECEPGHLFSVFTGKSCSIATTTNYVFTRDLSAKLKSKGADVIALQKFLKEEGYFFGKVDGKFGKITGRAVGDFQEDNDLSRTEIVDSATRVVLNKTSTTPPVDINAPVISGVNGPQTLNVNQQGTWKVTAYDKSGGNLSYSVVWGDERGWDTVDGIELAPYRQPAQQNATFTHSYSQTGIYEPRFMVTNTNGQIAGTSLSVNVGGAQNTNNFYIAPSSATIKVGGTATFQAMLNSCPPGAQCFVGPLPVQATWVSSNRNIATVAYKNVCPPKMYCIAIAPDYLTAVVTGVSEGTATITGTYTDSSGNNLKATAKVTVTGNGNSSSITVLSPNGGESWVKGTTQNITWQDNSTTLPCPAGTGCYKPAPKYFDITLFLYNTCSASGTEVCAAWSSMEKTIAKNIYGSSYSWLVGEALDGATISNDSAYKIQICQTGTYICDSSNNYFTITSPTTIPDDGTACLGGPMGCVRVTSLSPNSGLVGTQVTVNGSGFTLTGNKVEFGKMGDMNGSLFNSSNGKTLTFMAPFYSSLTGMSIQPGDYAVSITNSRGTSLPVTFTVTGEIYTPNTF